MREIKLFKRITACTLVLLLTIPFTAMSQQIGESITAQGPEKVFKPEELEQMLAPIALYPDALLAQVLTAATYPLEVVAADRFVKENPGLKGKALLEAAKTKDWEPSVKAMLEFPDVLGMMDEQLEWTEKLGDAFLAQQSDCMDAVQRLRQKAYAQGNLATTEKQVIRVEPKTQIIIIEPASPEVVYVPVYDPAIIYGFWWYLAYPPYYFYPRRYVGISFFSGVFVGAFWGAWGTWGCNWHSRDVYINLNRYNNFTRTHYESGNHYRFYKDGQSVQPWRHYTQYSESLRRRDSSTAQRFGEQQRPTLTGKSGTSDFRKYDQGTVNSPTISLREKARPTINTSKSSANIQISIKKQPTNDLRENARPTINTAKSSVNIQPSIKKQPTKVLRENVVNQVNTKPIATVDSKSDAGNQRSAGTSTSDLRVRESKKTSTSMSNVKGEIIARPSSNDSSRNKDDAHALTAEGRGRSGHATDDNLQPNPRILPSLKGFGVFSRAPVNVVGR